MIDSREWWLVEAMDTTMARQLVARWPYIHALPDGITKIINHRKISR